MRRIGSLVAILALASQFIFIAQAPKTFAAAGDTDTALTFNGSNNYLSKTDAAFAYRSTFTVQGWIRPTEVTCANNCTIFSHDADYIVSIISGKFQLWQYYNYNNITGQLDTGIQAKINEWQHVAYAYSSGVQRFYLNGQLVWQNTIAGWSSNPTYWGNLNLATTTAALTFMAKWMRFDFIQPPAPNQKLLLICIDGDLQMHQA